jgi:hypothetical protein
LYNLTCLHCFFIYVLKGSDCIDLAVAFLHDDCLNVSPSSPWRLLHTWVICDRLLISETLPRLYLLADILEHGYSPSRLSTLTLTKSYCFAWANISSVSFTWTIASTMHQPLWLRWDVNLISFFSSLNVCIIPVVIVERCYIGTSLDMIH